MSTVSGSEKTCKSLENSIVDDVFQVATRIAVRVVEQSIRTTFGSTTLDQSDRGWSFVEAVSRDRRVHSRMPGDRSGTFVYGPGRDGCSAVSFCSAGHTVADPQ